MEGEQDKREIEYKKVNERQRGGGEAEEREREREAENKWDSICVRAEFNVRVDNVDNVLLCKTIRKARDSILF